MSLIFSAEVFYAVRCHVCSHCSLAIVYAVSKTE